MQETTVSCGCGRDMALDGRRGRGAYRCGCGVRVRVSQTASNTSACSVDECRTASVTGPTIRLCAGHKDQITMVLAHDIARTDLKNLVQLQEQGAGRWKAPVIPVYEGPATEATDSAVVREMPASGRHDPVVYFLRNGERVKIGTTTNLRARITALSLRQSDVILLLDGGRTLEAAMHRRFSSHRQAGTEWFNFADEIKDFVRARPRSGKLNPDLLAKRPDLL
ncbi:GIY-YIG nuclease family protein [Streptomyces niveus]|uniref:GIY-YIG nuclease family protein n=1 Tax=Streptomyces niveus TaxID=193462 RepID=UPI0036D2823D